MVKFLFLRHRNRKMIGCTHPIRALCAVPPYRASLGVLLLCSDEILGGNGPAAGVLIGLSCALCAGAGCPLSVSARDAGRAATVDSAD
jgi:hypothetical protein